MYLKVLFFTCYNNIILIAIETHLLTFLKECINAIQRFWALQHVWSTIFQPRKAMVLLCALSLATHVASLLRSTAKTEAGLHDIAEAIEVMKEILTQISVNPSYKDHAATASFCHCWLYTLRGVLLEWNTSIVSCSWQRSKAAYVFSPFTHRHSKESHGCGWSIS